MARPKGRKKIARVTINLDESVYNSLVVVAMSNDEPVAQVARKAVLDYLRREDPSLDQMALPLVRAQQDQ